MPRVDNFEFYNRSFQKYGFDVKALNWNSKKTQEIRFKTILSLLPSKLNDIVIGDAGCGFGDFYLYLKNHGIDVKDYIGYDIFDDFVELARMQTAKNIYKADILKDEILECDYYVISGSLNILKPYEMFLFIKKCFDFSKKGLVFNFLDGDDQSDTFNYAKKSDILSYMADECESYMIRDGYLGSDVTILLNK